MTIGLRVACISKHTNMFPSQSAKVEELITKLARAKEVEPSSLSLIIDGERMAPSQTFESYDIEGGELIEVRIAS